MLKSEEEKNDAIRSCDFEIELDERQLCDVELLMQGGFSPLTGYMDEADYQSVTNDLKLTSGLIFGLVRFMCFSLLHLTIYVFDVIAENLRSYFFSYHFSFFSFSTFTITT